MADTELKTFTSLMDALLRISSNMKSMEQELRCPVCDDTVKQPILLPCQHSVCLLCAADVLVQRGYPPPDLPPEPQSPASTPNSRSPRQPRRPTTRTPDHLDRLLRTACSTYPGRRRKDTAPPPMLFPCPSCQEDVQLGERGLADCPRNLTLERVVERYRHTLSLGSVAIACAFCKPPQSLEATKGCADCKANFCNGCFKLYHPWGTPRAQHEHILPTHNFRPKVLTCTEHEQERLQWFCCSCQRLLCSLCKQRRVHHNHKVLPTTQAYQALKDQLTQQVNYILANQETIQSQITQLEAAIKQMEANSAVALHQLTRCMQELGASIAERQGSLATALEGSRSRRAETLSAQVSRRRDMLDQAGLMSYAHELLKETDQPCFVQAARVTHNRLVKAIANLRCFSLNADPSFRHFHLDATKEIPLISGLAFIRAPLAPVIDTQKTLAYDQLFLCWRLPQDSAPAWHFSVEFQRRTGAVGATWGGTRSPDASAAWRRLDEVRGTSAVVDQLQINSVYVLRVRGCNKAGFGDYSEEVYLHTPPAPVLSFSLDPGWGLHSDRLALGKGQTYARSVPGLSLLKVADRTLTACHLTSDLLVADLAVSQGRHYWACSVEPGSYLVKVGVGQEVRLQEWFHQPQDVTSPRYDPDSGHDSGAEDGQDPPPFCFLTVGMGKLLLPRGHAPHSLRDGKSVGSSHKATPPYTAPLPPRLGVCLDCDEGRVAFYDAHSLRVLWEGLVDCSAPVCPAFCFIGGGALQLQDLVASRSVEEEAEPPRLNAKSRATKLSK
ncbi:tripartite motif-containing protein 46 isoform X2 [Entelurus aequoreus]|uniref:tripartite motif-containing protein 46 isoform X2 n=1 Tax=Entelurus aequoreus TaxID=161455 RepID=UPI002B1E8466|nr:tripartite motif-containing protein 46 isoform X2 [Entelurus aequoreus]